MFLKLGKRSWAVKRGCGQNLLMLPPVVGGWRPESQSWCRVLLGQEPPTLSLFSACLLVSPTSQRQECSPHVPDTQIHRHTQRTRREGEWRTRRQKGEWRTRRAQLAKSFMFNFFFLNYNLKAFLGLGMEKNLLLPYFGCKSTSFWKMIINMFMFTQMTGLSYWFFSPS